MPAALGQPAPPASSPAESEQRLQPPLIAEPPPYRLFGYVEALYQWNFNRPSNGITNYRGFDNRHNSFTLSNVALGAELDYKDVLGALALQIGHTPSTYYAAEPASPGASGANASGPELWKYLQQAYAGYRFADVLSVTVGLFLSPIGPEGMAVKDNWNWSRSNLFFGFPFYHTGARATYALSDTWAFTLAAYNGWNSVVDNNSQKSLSAQMVYTRPALSLSVLYFGGVERSRHVPEGDPWRNLFDVHATWKALPWLTLLAHANGGFERTSVGAARWAAGALYARTRLAEGLYLAARGDAFFEHTPGAATPIFWPVGWVSSLTATLEYRLAEHVSFRAEYRHDRAQRAMFFRRTVPSDPTGAPVMDTRLQNTVTLGATAWF